MGCAGSVGCTGRFPISLLTLSDRIIVIGASYVPGFSAAVSPAIRRMAAHCVTGGIAG